jgi:16S rRNA G527 N7-methylase RsmG
MVERRERKAAFLREVVSRLRLADTKVLTARIEDLNGLKMEGSVDFITLRGVRLSREVLDCVVSLLGPAGRLLLFRGSMPLVFNEFRLRLIGHRALAPSNGFVSIFGKAV